MGGAIESGTPAGTRTPNPQIRNLMLYPVELRAHKFILRDLCPTKPVFCPWPFAEESH